MVHCWFSGGSADQKSEAKSVEESEPEPMVEVNPPIRTKNLLRNASHRLAYIAVVLYIEERRTEGGYCTVHCRSDGECRLFQMEFKPKFLKKLSVETARASLEVPEEKHLFRRFVYIVQK